MIGRRSSADNFRNAITEPVKVMAPMARQRHFDQAGAVDMTDSADPRRRGIERAGGTGTAAMPTSE
jgi:hypothetical protein